MRNKVQIEVDGARLQKIINAILDQTPIENEISIRFENHYTQTTHLFNLEIAWQNNELNADIFHLVRNA